MRLACKQFKVRKYGKINSKDLALFDKLKTKLFTLYTDKYFI